MSKKRPPWRKGDRVAVCPHVISPQHRMPEDWGIPGVKHFTELNKFQSESLSDDDGCYHYVVHPKRQTGDLGDECSEIIRENGVYILKYLGRHYYDDTTYNFWDLVQPEGEE